MFLLFRDPVFFLAFVMVKQVAGRGQFSKKGEGEGTLAIIR